jgi:hypothetical protein
MNCETPKKRGLINLKLDPCASIKGDVINLTLIESPYKWR